MSETEGSHVGVQEASGVRGHREVEYSVVGWKEKPAAKEMLLIMFENVLLVLYRAFLNSFSLVRHYFLTSVYKYCNTDNYVSEFIFYFSSP